MRLLQTVPRGDSNYANVDAGRGTDGFRQVRIWNDAQRACRRTNLPRPLSSRPERETAAQGSRVTCASYDLNDFGAMRVALLFSSEGRLVGYVMYTARHRHDDVRTKMESLYGPPTRQWEMGRWITWLWLSGTEAILTIFCQGTDGCLIVKAKAPEKNAAPEKR